jgi:hypothetical protein
MSINRITAWWSTIRRSQATVDAGRIAEENSPMPPRDDGRVARRTRYCNALACSNRLDNGLGKLEGEDKCLARRELVVPQLNKINATLEKLDRQFPSKGLMHTAI